MPSRPIQRRRTGPDLWDHVLVSGYADRLQLYRKNQIARPQGLYLDLSTPADRTGKTTVAPEALTWSNRPHV